MFEDEGKEQGIRIEQLVLSQHLHLAKEERGMSAEKVGEGGRKETSRYSYPVNNSFTAGHLLLELSKQ